MSADRSDGMETSTYEGTSRGNTHGGFARDALSNHLVLRRIFQQLENDDVNSCCQVNKCWNYVADPILVRYYDIKEKNEMYLWDEERPIVFDITKQATYSSNVKFYFVGLRNASSLLEAALQTGRIGIRLVISLNREEEDLVLFLSKFGNFVEKLKVGPECRVPWTRLLELLVHYVKKVKHLDLSMCDSRTWDEYFDCNLLENQMRQLRVVHFGEENYYPAGLNILRMAPNLEEIQDFPIDWGDALVETQTAGLVKSLGCHAHNGGSVVSNLEKLSNIDLKLKYFSFRTSSPMSCIEFQLFEDENTWPFLLRILQSSHDSLESLTLWKTHSPDFGPFPFDSILPMNSLKEITFLMVGYNAARKFFDPEIVLGKLFPNVTTVKFPWDFFYDPVADITAGFPVEQYAPWGSQIDTLIELRYISVNTLQQLHKLFPSVKKLEFWASGKCIRLQLLLKAFGKYWPDMESLTVVVREPYHPQFFYDDECTFDSVFTGVPGRIISQLKHQFSRRDLPSEDAIQGFKEASIIRKLSKLKMQKFDFSLSRPRESRRYELLDKLLAMTPFSKEFGFDYVPKLQIVVQTQSDQVVKRVSRKIRRLEACVNFKVEKVSPRL